MLQNFSSTNKVCMYVCIYEMQKASFLISRSKIPYPLQSSAIQVFVLVPLFSSLRQIEISKIQQKK